MGNIVGKSSLVYRFLNYNPPLEHYITIEDRYKQEVDIGEKNYEVELLDTAGDKDYENMIDRWIDFGEGFLLVFLLMMQKVLNQ